MRVEFSSEAKADLRAVGDYIARDNPRRAASFIRELRDVARRLGDTPHAYPTLPRYQHLGLRRRPWHDYLILYRVEEDRVLIVHVIHGARDYEGGLGGV